MAKEKGPDKGTTKKTAQKISKDSTTGKFIKRNEGSNKACVITEKTSTGSTGPKKKP